MIKMRSYELAVELYHEVTKLKLKAHLQDQLERASSSVALNLAEGWGKRTKKDRERFFTHAFGSIREIQAICDLEPTDGLAAAVYRLTR